ncbi:MAG: hypothetical protein OWQ51_06390 [Pyrobaculum arsenaticum]|uniref:Uncharacterized protein n=1 Tax=Pyrobaculum arsenaticum TaxID=121277 RepID=A0A7L4P5D7_9CREN|nr:hypothetical protein [Pyrobaculum arsenaticum]MCY0890590.1 hypothetical protein [Pyrobaculum arsenaticum]NYR14469.1 hypothetical protein [Pyrobaculum arsenaticum]
MYRGGKVNGSHAYSYTQALHAQEEICNAAASVEGAKPNLAVVVDRVVF